MELLTSAFSAIVAQLKGWPTGAFLLWWLFFLLAAIALLNGAIFAIFYVWRLFKHREAILRRIPDPSLRVGELTLGHEALTSEKRVSEEAVNEIERLTNSSLAPILFS